MIRPLDAGLLVVIEGIDGTGKSTLARRLAEKLEQSGENVVLSGEPTQGPFGRRLRDSANTGRLAPAEELELFVADRREHVEGLILPSLKKGKLMILDRYYFSTAAYQGARGTDWRHILDENEQFAPNPDLLIFLDLSVEESLKRIGKRGGTADSFEQAGALERVRDIYHSLLAKRLGTVWLNAQEPADVVLDRAIREVVQIRGGITPSELHLDGCARKKLSSGA
ncbi:MAG: dTMP kinase [Pedosphaera sp.]|nr:dTMP kinase [Pedosphaera sp.]